MGGIVARNVRHPGEIWQRRRLGELAADGIVPATGSVADLWFAHLDPFVALAGDLVDASSDADHIRADRIADVQSRRVWLTSRVLLRAVLTRYRKPRLSADDPGLEICVGPHGKPFVSADDHGPLHFNLSHHRRADGPAVWVLGVSRAGAVGVDIESLRAVPHAERLAQRVFSTDERGELAAAAAESAAERDRVFLCGWTRKEALLKAIGDGFTRPARALHVGTTTANPRETGLSLSVPDAGRYTVFSLRSPQDHLVAAALAFEPSDWRLFELKP